MDFRLFDNEFLIFSVDASFCWLNRENLRPNSEFDWISNEIHLEQMAHNFGWNVFDLKSRTEQTYRTVQLKMI